MIKSRIKVDKTMRKKYNKFYDEMIAIALNSEGYKKFYDDEFNDVPTENYKMDLSYADSKMRSKWLSVIDNATYDLWLNDTLGRTNFYVKGLPGLNKVYAEQREKALSERMWYVESIVDGEINRWEGLTKDQAQWVYMNKMSGKAKIEMMR